LVRFVDIGYPPGGAPGDGGRRRAAIGAESGGAVPEFDVYRARSDPGRAESLDAAGPFGIEVRFLGDLRPSSRAAFVAAADRWTRMIVGDLPPVVVDGEPIDDLLILAQATPIDGPGRILGQAGPTHLRPASAGRAAFLPAKGVMFFDLDDLERLEADGTLQDVIAHEMGHVLGIGTIWKHKGLLKGENSRNPTFAGEGAMREYQRLRGGLRRRRVPVENTGGPGTRHGHWRESVFGDELMSGYVAAPGNALSALTVASLADLGYRVDLAAAEPYDLPDASPPEPPALFAARSSVAGAGVVFPAVPAVLPVDAPTGAAPADGPPSARA
jgi:Leishmanolysin